MKIKIKVKGGYVRKFAWLPIIVPSWNHMGYNGSFIQHKTLVWLSWYEVDESTRGYKL